MCVGVGVVVVGVGWFIFRRNLDEQETSQFQALLEILGKAFIPRQRKDKRLWMASADGMFLVATLFMALSINVSINSPNLAKFWRLKAPQESLFSAGRSFMEVF